MDSTSDVESRICDVWIWNGNYQSRQSRDPRLNEITQKAWWDAILAILAIDCDRKTVHVALELRITGGSNIILAPQRGNDLGTFSIEVLSTLATPEDDWHAFCQSLAN
jgi:hypothetical protein